MGHIRIRAKLRGDNELVLTEAGALTVQCVGFLNGGDARVIISGDQIAIFPTTGFGYRGSILDWLDAARSSHSSAMIPRSTWGNDQPLPVVPQRVTP